MTSITSVSQAELAQRRNQLRRQRRLKAFQAIWRSVLVSGLAGGLFWVITLPDWVIRNPEQIDVEGNQLLSASKVRSLLRLSYPQSLLKLQPQAIAQKLESQAPIAQATVTRQLLPPSLTIQVKERQPIAIAQPPASNKQATASKAKPRPMGLLDEQGIWIPLDSYRNGKRSLKLPTLKIIGRHEQYRAYWSPLYQAMSHSPVKVFEIDCQDPVNLIIKTELGKVHLGAYSSRIAYQIKVLDRMRELPSHINPNEIDYIDLKNPDVPSIQLKKTSKQ